ncbi:Hypothetical predicted protein [Cloeon dipterum]|uniref:Peptidase S1 domain-containing protein n=1 Tax=Cloeon dipterum TaxID=197152 RepID=A0A8S1CFH3_9INSE|nr:Hypothetical predicted protein [Cloeon dipterum]
MNAVTLVFLFGSLFLAQAAVVPWAVYGPKIHVNTWRSAPTETRIVGGTYADNGQFPWQVGMYLDGSGFCGGSLISDTVVLTAGHCVDGTRTFTVHVGSVDIDLTTEPAQIISASTKVLHEYYAAQNLLNDIGLVLLDAPVQGANIQPIRLPGRSQIEETFEGVIGTASGWGRVSDDDSRLSQYLNFVNLTVISNVDCEAIYGAAVNDAKLCVSTRGGLAGTCFGDSGGPLVIYEPDGIATEIGITSFVADEGCQTGLPAGFTRISLYLDWISQNAGVPVRP